MRFVSLVDTRFTFGDADLALGIEAALLEANGSSSVFGTTFRHDIIESSAAYSLTQPATSVVAANSFFNTVHNFSSDATFYGFVGMSAYTATALDRLQKQTRQTHPPSFGPRLLANGLDVRQQVAYRGEPLTEIPFLLAFAMHRAGILCTQGVIFRPDTIPSTRFTTFTNAFVASGFPSPTTFLRNSTTSSTATPIPGYNDTAINATLTSQPDACLFIFDTFEYASAVITYVGARLSMPSRFIFLYSQSVGGTFSASARPYTQNTYVSQQVPNPNNLTTLLVRKARAAVTVAALRNASRPAAVHALTSMSVVNTHHLEGYLVGRMLLQLVQNTVSVTPTALVDAAYLSRLQVDDFSLAPLTDSCQEGTDFPCFCNVAGRAYYIHRANATNGELYGVEEDLTNSESGIARKTVSTTSCLELSVTLRRPFNVLALTPPTTTSSTLRALATGRTFTTMKSALTLRNGEMGDTGTMHVISATLAGSAAAMGATVTALDTRFLPFVVVGGENAATPSGMQLDATPAALREEDTWQANTLHLEPAMSHYLHAVAARAGGDMVVIADSARVAALAETSLNTFEHRILEAHILNATTATAAALTTTTETLKSALQAGKRVVVASNNVSTVAALLLAAQGAAPLPATAATTAALYIVAHELVLQDAVATANLTSTSVLAGNATSVPLVRFTSIHDPWWSTNTGIVANLLQSLYRRRTVTDVAEIKGLYVSEAIFALSTNAVISGNGASAVRSLSAVSTITAAGLSIGPVYLQACTTVSGNFYQRQCECSAGPRRFMLYALRDLLTKTATSTTGNSSTTLSYTLEGCGFETRPLPPSFVTSDNSAFIVAVTAGPASAVIALLVAAVAVVLCCTGRSHRHAPTNSSEPFAMVFTDIQSSTSLWARAPAAMSRAVEDHHRIIRKLIKKHKGYEVKTIGDSFMVAFRHPESATALGIDIQRALFDAAWPPEIDGVYKALALEKAEEDAAVEQAPATNGKNSSAVPPSATNTAARLCLPENASEYSARWCGLRVRVGVHFGLGTISRDETTGSFDYYGTVVNTAARIEGVGHGGQVLLSQDAFSALPCDFLHDELSAAPTGLGPQPLRGLDAPIALVLLAPLELAAREYPPLRLDVDHAQTVVAAENEMNDNANEGNGAAEDPSVAGSRYTVSDAGSSAHRVQSPADALLRCARLFRLSPDLLEGHVAVVKMLLATSSDSTQRDIVAGLMKKWHVPPCKTGARTGLLPIMVTNHGDDATTATSTSLFHSAPQAHDINLINLIAKVLRASETRDTSGGSNASGSRRSQQWARPTGKDLLGASTSSRGSQASPSAPFTPLSP